VSVAAIAAAAAAACVGSLVGLGSFGMVHKGKQWEWGNNFN
jgi:hypothetical protein